MATGAAFKTALLRLMNHHCRTLKELKQVQAQITVSPSPSDDDRFFLTTRLLFFCAVSDFGSLPYADRIFRRIPNPDLFVFNAMIRAHSSKPNCTSDSLDSLVLFKQMLRSGILPNSLSFPFLIKHCSSINDPVSAEIVYSHAVKLGFNGDVYTQNSMINMYSENGDVNTARKVFDETPERDIASWNSMISGCFRNGCPDFALDLFHKMEKKKKNQYTWNSIITGCVQSNRSQQALSFFHEMITENLLEPDKITISSVLTACSSLNAVDHGIWVHNYLKKLKKIEVDVVVSTALVDMYGKCGCLQKALEVFNGVGQTHRDTFLYTSMISVLASHGRASSALELFNQMIGEKIRPNHVTFVAALSACAHAGMIHEARSIFSSMETTHAIKPQVYHYAIVVDLLSRAGLLEEAEGVVRRMPMAPDVFVYGALLGGCRRHGNVDVGERAARKLIDLDPWNYGVYENLCGVYGRGGRFEEVRRVRKMMQEMGMKKEVAGCSRVEVEGCVYEFSVMGEPEVAMEVVECVLRGLVGEMRKEGVGEEEFGLWC